MKKAVASIVALVLLLPAVSWSKGGAFKESISKIADINVSAIEQNGHLLSTVLDIKMIDGKEFLIAVDVDKKNMIATFTFASGNAVMLSPHGIEIIEGEGYQDYDDVDNTIRMEPHLSNACLINVIAYWILPYPLNLIALYYAFLTCF